MKKKLIIILPALAVLVIAGLFVPLKKVETGGSCPGVVYTQRHNLILGDTLPPAGPNSIGGEGCAPLGKHTLYLL